MEKWNTVENSYPMVRLTHERFTRVAGLTDFTGFSGNSCSMGNPDCNLDVSANLSPVFTGHFGVVFETLIIVTKCCERVELALVGLR